MASFDNILTIAKDSGFQNRCQYALTVAAVNVIAETADTLNHAVRATYAKQVLRGAGSLLSLAMAVLTNPTIAAEADVTKGPDWSIPDSDIAFAVNSLFNALAG